MQSDPKQKRGSEIDISELFKKKKQNDLYTEKPLATLIDVYIIGEIDEASEYVELFDKIRNAGEMDIIKLHINSCGGYLHTAVQFLRCLNETGARVIASIEGDCMSAATVLMLSAHSYEISDHSSVMVHSATQGMFGKNHELRDRAQFDKAWADRFFADVYKDFLTAEEITQMVDGKDFWFSTQETIERLNIRQALRLERAKAEEKKQAKKTKTVTK